PGRALVEVVALFADELDVLRQALGRSFCEPTPNVGTPGLVRGLGFGFFGEAVPFEHVADAHYRDRVGGDDVSGVVEAGSRDDPTDRAVLVGPVEMRPCVRVVGVGGDERTAAVVAARMDVREEQAAVRADPLMFGSVGRVGTEPLVELPTGDGHG